MTLFCSDIDGTLLNPERTLSDRTVAAIRSTLDAGHSFVLCSSRMPSSMRILEGLYDGHDAPMIAYNGGLVLRSDGSASLNVPIGERDARALYERCRDLNVHMSVYVGDDWYAWDDDFWSRRETNNTAVAPSLRSAHDYFGETRLPGGSPHKVMCMGESNLIDQIASSVGGMAGLISYRSKDTYLEIANGNCSKGDAVKSVAGDLQVALSDVVFFGDNYNDLPAFAVVGTSVAVANGRPEVLAAATHTTARHHDDGVAQFLESWIGS
ncbi:Cof-type HAD-IIB family hydrolase [Terrabacter sp. NPDC080008]|uniref:Cof-type HAD-IIB family hydrolase n=1 Tax=Terrabacter sp. NPDC080008 TaxID=3155176 RepID=UPI00344B0179